MTPEAVVQRQLEAYNHHDLEAFLACYGADAQLFRLPEPSPWLSGTTEIGRFYAANRFNLPGLRAEILNRMTLGNKVVDHERVQGLGPGTTEVVAVYEVVDGLITQVWFHRPS